MLILPKRISSILESQYRPLLADENEEGLEKRNDVEDRSEIQKLHVGAVAGSAGRSVHFIIIFVQTILLVGLAMVLWNRERPDCPINPVFPQVLYSPAQDALEYQPKTFTMGFGRHKTIYEGDPSPEVDKAWLDMFNEFGLSKIPKSQARLLPNKTLPIPGDEENYAVGLEVFHQLHCLNILRHAMTPDYYTDPVTGNIAGLPAAEWPDHVSHCLEALRQGIICASDIRQVPSAVVEVAIS
ncbi:hypothetical protein QCA50_008732 [Cerrena zonata]|uniref:Cyclochlorotine biosynthesis protein O n=1 Tax=Cerrena zonata TaxID=2478898 RepID=A0AAW0GHA5_9APHY